MCFIELRGSVPNFGRMEWRQIGWPQSVLMGAVGFSRCGVRLLHNSGIRSQCGVRRLSTQAFYRRIPAEGLLRAARSSHSSSRKNRRE
jgi:hypothetical protein